MFLFVYNSPLGTKTERVCTSIADRTGTEMTPEVKAFLYVDLTYEHLAK